MPEQYKLDKLAAAMGQGWMGGPHSWLRRAGRAVLPGAATQASPVAEATGVARQALQSITPRMRGAKTPADVDRLLSQAEPLLSKLPKSEAAELSAAIQQARISKLTEMAETGGMATGAGGDLTSGQMARQLASRHSVPLGIAGGAAGALGAAALAGGGGGEEPRRRGGGGMIVMGSAEEIEKTAMEKEALRPWMKALGIGALGAGAGGALGFGMGKRHYEPAVMSMAHPETGQYMGDMIGGRDAVEDLYEELAEEGIDYEDIQNALAEAESRGVVFKGASDRTAEKYATAGQIMARSFVRALNKKASACAEGLAEAGWIAPEAVYAVHNTSDVTKLASVIALTATAIVAEEMDKEAGVGSFLGKGLSGWGKRLQAAFGEGGKGFSTLFKGPSGAATSRFSTPELALAGGAAGLTGLALS